MKILIKKAESNNFMSSCLDILADFLCFSGAYAWSYARSRQFKMNFKQRRRLYIFSSILALLASVTSRFIIKKVNFK